MPSIVALVKNVPDTWSEKTLKPDYTLDRDNVDNVIDEVNQYSVEQALRIKEAHPEENYRVVALSAGPEQSEEALRKALAMGADEAMLLNDQRLAGSDILGTAWALASAIRTIPDVQLVICGAASSDGAAGALAGILSEYWPAAALTQLISAEVAGNTVRGIRETSAGRWELEATFPAVLSFSDKADKPRYPNFKGLRAAKQAHITRLQLEHIGVADNQVGLHSAATQVQEATKAPARQAGEIIYDTDSAETAQKIVAFLQERSLLR